MALSGPTRSETASARHHDLSGNLLPSFLEFLSEAFATASYYGRIRFAVLFGVPQEPCRRLSICNTIDNSYNEAMAGAGGFEQIRLIFTIRITQHIEITIFYVNDRLRFMLYPVSTNIADFQLSYK